MSGRERAPCELLPVSRRLAALGRGRAASVGQPSSRGREGDKAGRRAEPDTMGVGLVRGAGPSLWQAIQVSILLTRRRARDVASARGPTPGAHRG